MQIELQIKEKPVWQIDCINGKISLSKNYLKQNKKKTTLVFFSFLVNSLFHQVRNCDVQ